MGACARAQRDWDFIPLHVVMGRIDKPVETMQGSGRYPESPWRQDSRWCLPLPVSSGWVAYHDMLDVHPADVVAV